MTITLAAVYIPIGLQGGLTGTLFREFAFTLAGAVTISGVVALTLSPMMSAKFLRAGDEEHGFAGMVNRTFDRFRDWYGRHARSHAAGAPGGLRGLDRRSRYHRRDFSRKFSMLGAKELAPNEDQGVIFGIINAPANATIDDRLRLCRRGRESFPEFPANAFHFSDHISHRTASAAWF